MDARQTRKECDGMTLDELARLAEAADEEYHAVFGAEARWSDNVFGDSDAD